LAIAVASSSVNPASRDSVSAGRNSPPVNATTIAPHSWPSTLNGTPTDERSPQPLATWPMTPEISSSSWSIRAGRAVRHTSVATVSLAGLYSSHG